MGKIKFGDYLKTRKSQQNQNIYESDEALVRRARSKMELDSLVISPSFRVQNLESAKRMLEEAKSYPGAEELLEKCREMLHAAKAARKEADYQSACLHLSEAGDEYEFDKAAGEFGNLQGYRDADEKHAEAKKKSRALNRKFQVKRGIIILVLVLIAVLIVTGVRNGIPHYAAAKLEGLAGQYKAAAANFDGMHVLDSDRQAEKYYALYLEQRQAEEQKTLPRARKGSTISYAGQHWLVLKKKDKKLLMVCLTPFANSPYRHVQFHDEREDVSWADSSLREFLNTDVLKGEFTEAEQAALVEMEYTPSGNADYGVKGDTRVLKDKIRILDMAEVEEYADVLGKPGVDMWLSTQGYDAASAVYMTKTGMLMSYGNDVTDDGLSACPVVTVDVQLLKKAELD